MIQLAGIKPEADYHAILSFFYHLGKHIAKGLKSPSLRLGSYKKRRRKVWKEKKMGVHRNSPRSSPISPNSSLDSPRKNSSPTLLSLFNLEPDNNRAADTSTKTIMKQPSFESENQQILSFIFYCSCIYSFTDPLESRSEQDFKRVKLIQLLAFVKSPKKKLPAQILRPLMSMLSVNLFRPLPASCNHPTDFPDDEELASNLSPSWPHLHLVYDILHRLVLNTDPKILRDYIDQSFVVNLLALFQTEDPRERESLKNVFHRIYLKFTFHRSFMRKAMNDVFLHYVSEGEKHCGIGELLEIWGSIINGFTVPLKEEHRMFLMRVLIPLHKTKGMQVYHRQLAYCISQFVQKEPMLGGIIVRGILRYWPVTNCQKEVLLISELEDLVDNIDPDQYRMLALPLCTQITRCLNSWNSQVAERALYVWNNEQFVKMASSAMEDVLPVVVKGMEKNLKWHWSKSVKQLTENVKAMLEEMDPILYEKCLQEIGHKEYLARQEEIKRKEKWERIELEAAKKQFLQPQHQCILVSH